MEIYTYVHNILKGDLPTRASGRERPGQSSVHFDEIGSIAGLTPLSTQLAMLIEIFLGVILGLYDPLWHVEYLPTRASGRERPGQSSVHFGEIGSIAGF